MDSLLADLRYAARGLLRRPAFSALAILTLAVGIGINTVAFTGVNALLFHAFVFPGVDRLGWVMLSSPGAPHGDLSRDEFEALRRGVRVFDAVAAEGRQPLALMNGAGAEQVWGLFVSKDYFDLLGTHAVAGRLDTTSTPPDTVAAVVSFRFWRAHLGGGSIAGRTIVIANRTVPVAGVLPDDFQGPGGLYAPDVWLPLDQAEALGLPRTVTTDAHWLTTIGRLAPGATSSQAAAELAAFAAHLPASSDQPAAGDRRLGFFPMREGHPDLRGLAPFVWLALSIVSLVLLIACFNVGSLLLARAVERRREIAVRSALGAGRLRIVRQLLVEGLVMASLSGAAALALAAWSERLLAIFSLPAPIPQRLHLHIDGRVIAFTALMVVTAGLLPPLLPALRATRRSLAGSMRVDGERRPSRLRHLFVGAQVAGSTLFLATALLFVRSFTNATRADLGFDPDHLLVVRLEPAAYAVDGDRAAALARQLLERLRANQGLTIAAADRAPFAVGYPRTARISTRDRRCEAGCRPTTFFAVDDRYLLVSGIPLRAGRTFDAQDLRAGGAVIVNEAMAAALWPGRSPLGETITTDDGALPATVIGVAGSTPTAPGIAAAPLFYRPIRDRDFAAGFSLLVRATGSDAVAAAALRDAVQSVAPTVPISQLTTTRELLEVPMWPRRTAAGLFSVCGALALVLATVGLFGTTYFAVRQRTREFGVRMAIGATPRRILSQVMAEGVRLVVPSAAIGLLLAAAAGRLLSRALFGVSPSDALSFGSAAAIEIVVALVACALPAREATRVDPMIALRSE